MHLGQGSANETGDKCATIPGLENCCLDFDCVAESGLILIPHLHR